MMRGRSSFFVNGGNVNVESAKKSRVEKISKLSIQLGRSESHISGTRAFASYLRVEPGKMGWN
jgi:hypothetical protein